MARARRRGRRAGARPRRRQRARRARPRAAPGTRSSRSTSTRCCSRRSRERAEAACRSQTVRGRRARLRSHPRTAASRSCSRRCRRSSCSAGRAGAPGCCAARVTTCAPAGCSRARWPTRSRASTPSTPSRRCPTCSSSDGWVYASHPVAVRPDADGTTIERIRQSVAPDGARIAEGDVVRLDKLDGDTLEAEGVAAGFAPRWAALRRDDRRARRLARWCCCVPDHAARLRALPELMNIYADRGNLLLLQRRCEWRGIGFELTASDLGEPLDPDAARPLLPRRRPGPRPAPVRARPRRGQARRAARRGRARRGAARGLRRLPAARPLLRAGRRDAARRRASSTCAPCASDGPRLIGNVAIEVELGGGAPAGSRRLREPRRPHAPRRRRAAARAGAARSRQRRCAAASRASRRRERHRHLPARPAAAEERVVRRLADRPRARP